MTETKSGIESIIVDDLDEAKQVMGAMRERISLYGFASVADLYDLIGVTGNFDDTRWGWRNTLDFANSKVKAAEDGAFEITLPQPGPADGARPITQVKATPKFRLWYFIPHSNELIDASLNVNINDAVTMVWVDQMVKSSPELIFFLVTDTTDLPEEAFS